MGAANTLYFPFGFSEKPKGFVSIFYGNPLLFRRLSIDREIFIPYNMYK